MDRKKWLILAGLALAAVALVAIPTEVSFSKDVQPILTKACVDCHGPKKARAQLNLDPSVAYKNLVNKPSSMLKDTVLVTPGHPESSFLWQKLDHTQKEGDGMPKGMFGAKKLPQEQLDLIKAWIEGGAKE